MTKYWIAVASRGHVWRGVHEGFMQVCHGKSAPLQRLRPKDGVIYYSPSHEMGKSDGLQSFTAFGFVREGYVYQADMGGGFKPFRRDVDWCKVEDAPIRPLLAKLDFITDKTHWGTPFRYGLLAISEQDFNLIRQVMQRPIHSKVD